MRASERACVGEKKEKKGDRAIYNEETQKVTARRRREERMTVIFWNIVNRTSGGGFLLLPILRELKMKCRETVTYRREGVGGGVGEVEESGGWGL